MRFDLVISGGILVTPLGTFAGTVGIRNGRIAALASGTERWPAEQTVDVSGRVILPGAVDLHVHCNDPGRAHWEGFAHGTRAAAAGGVTTVVDMPLNCLPATTTVEALEAKKAAVAPQAVVDYALWGGFITDNLDHLEGLAGRGIIGFKAFMSHSSTEEFTHVEDGILYEGLRRIAALGHFLAVHAESNDITRDRTQRLRAASRRDRRAWGEARPPEAELEAIHRALFLARVAGARLHIVHMSLPEGAQMIAEARRAGQMVTVETCPHYLVLDEDALARIGPAAKCAPPLRDRGRVEGLWEALRAGLIDCITSDHSPCPTGDKQRGEDDIWEAWGGIIGIQTMVPLLLTEGVHRRGLSVQHCAALLSTNPAKIAGLWPRKGAIRAGADADLVIVDMGREWTVEASWIQSRHKHSPFIGRRLTGWIEGVLARGEWVARGGEVVGRPGRGELIRPDGRLRSLE